MKKPIAIIALITICVLTGFGQEDVPPKALELNDALRLALGRNPQLRAAQLGIQAADGRLLQSGTIPNPSLSAEIEDFGGSGDLQGMDGSSTTLALEQTLELGGKRAIRKNVAKAEMKLAEWERDACRLDVIKETKVRFIAVLSSQEDLAISQEAWQIAETIYQAVSNRVMAGKDSPVEEAKARTELALAKLAMERTKSRLAVDRKTLCAMWSDNLPSFESVRGDLARMPENILALNLLQDAMTRSPTWARWADEIIFAERIVQADQRSRIPDLIIGTGVRQSQADDSQAFIATVGVELPIFDRKRGNIMAAKAELERKRAEQEATHTALSTELTTAHELMNTMRNAVLTLTQEALPAAELAFSAAQASYVSGKIGYLDIQDARRSLIELKREKIETLAEYHRAAVQVEWLTGSGLDEIKHK